MDSYAPISHASSSTTYGVGSSSNYGHLKISDNYTSSAGSASDGVAASSSAVYNTFSNSWSLASATSIASGADINDYITTAGNYMCSQNSSATGISNLPENVAFTMKVYSSTGSSISTTSSYRYATQSLETYTGTRYLRYYQYNNGTIVYSDWRRFVYQNGTSATGSSNKPCYINSSGAATACNEFMPITGSTFTGLAYAQTNTSYTTYQLRNIALTTSTPSSLTNGYVCMVYS